MRRLLLIAALLATLLATAQAMAQPSALDQARTLFSEGKLAEAETQARLAVEQDPNSVETHYMLGLILLMRDKNDQSAAELERAVQIDPRHYAAQRTLGVALLNKGDLAGSKRHFELAIQLKPDDGEAYVDYAGALMVSGDSQGALDLLLKARQLNSEHPGLRRTLAIIYVSRGQWAQAEAELKPLAATPAGQAADVQYLLGFTLFNLQRNAEAKPYFRRSLELEAAHCMPHYYLGLIALSEGDLKTGEAELRAAMRQDPSFADAPLDLGRMLAETNRPREALELLQTARRLNPTDAEPLFWLGRCHLALNDSAAAKADLESYLAQAPNGRWTAQTRQLLQQIR